MGEQRFQPVVGQLHVGVDERDQRRGHLRQPRVARSGRAPVRVMPNERVSQLGHGVVARFEGERGGAGVVDDDDVHADGQVAWQATERGDHDRDLRGA